MVVSVDIKCEKFLFRVPIFELPVPHILKSYYFYGHYQIYSQKFKNPYIWEDCVLAAKADAAVNWERPCRKFRS